MQSRKEYSFHKNITQITIRLDLVHRNLQIDNHVQTLSYVNTCVYKHDYKFLQYFPPCRTC
ncbi:hypothetical protein Hanom_Chr00s000004g01610001 [Helianthus anomalus]